jgi:hypothetical protein
VLPLLVDALGRIGVEVQPLSVDLPTLFGRPAGADNASRSACTPVRAAS